MARMLFTTYFEGSFHEWTELERWYKEQQNFDGPESCLDILDRLYADGEARHSGVEYRLVAPEEFALQMKALTERVVWEEGLDQSYLFPRAA